MKYCNFCQREVYISMKFGEYCIFHYDSPEYESDRMNWLDKNEVIPESASERFALALHSEAPWS